MIKASNIDIARAATRNELIPYTCGYWPSYRPALHHYLIAEALEEVEKGNIKRLMIFAPPRHGKSLLTSVNFPSWYLGRHPDHYMICAAYGQELAEDFGRQVKARMTDPYHAFVFPECKVRDDSQSAKRMNTTKDGAYFAVGVGGSVTGRGAHILLIDDPVKNREDADSELIREKVWNWYTSTAYTRLMPGGAVVIMLTRWHDDDLAGRLLKREPEKWTVLNLPAIAEDDDIVTERKAGDALWPDDYPVAVLEDIKSTIGPRDWSALYQQKPTPDEGGLIQPAWFQRYNADPGGGRVVLSFDTAHKDKEVNDPSCCLVWRETGRGHYLLDIWKERVKYPALKRAAASLIEKWKPDAVLIEDKASGQSLGQDLLEDNPKAPVLMIEPQGNKVVRAGACSSLIEAGSVYLPHSAPWLVDFEVEVGAFPLAAHDDQVDALTQYLNWCKLKGIPMIEKDRLAFLADALKKETPLRSYHFSLGQWLADKQGELQVWQEPAPQAYIIGVHPQATRHGAHVATVMLHGSGVQVAQWRGLCELDAFAAAVVALHQRYNGAWVIAESETAPALIQFLIQGGCRRLFAETEIIPPNKPKPRYGFRVTPKTLEPLMEALSKEIRNGTHGIKDGEICGEIKGFRRDDDGIVIELGYNRERVIARALAGHARTVLPKPLVNTGPTTATGKHGAFV